MSASGVVDALDALAGLLVAVAHGVEIDVVVALAESAGYSQLRVAEVTVGADLATGSWAKIIIEMNINFIVKVVMRVSSNE